MVLAMWNNRRVGLIPTANTDDICLRCIVCCVQVLKELAPYKQLVVSTGGGAVKDPMNWSYMHNGIVAWLQGEPELLARRVVAEGVEKRPLLYGEGVTSE